MKDRNGIFNVSIHRPLKVKRPLLKYLLDDAELSINKSGTLGVDFICVIFLVHISVCTRKMTSIINEHIVTMVFHG